MENTEENVITTTPPAPIEVENPVEEKKKTGSGPKIIAIVAILFACVGIGFGIYEMFEANNAKSELTEKDKKISALNASIDTLNTKIEELENEKTTDDKDKKEETEYIEIEEFGLKVKKSKDLPNMVAYATDENHFVIKASPNAEDDPSVSVGFMKVDTCKDEELSLGYGLKIEISGTCFIMGETLPYGMDDEFPMTTFLKYVKDKSIYSAI